MNTPTPSGVPSGAVHVGGCHCGEVRYEVRGKLHDAKLCHCNLCRKLHGHVSSYASVEKDALHLIREEGLRWYRLSDQSDRGVLQGMRIIPVLAAGPFSGDCDYARYT